MLSSAILLVVLLTGSLNFTVNIESQKSIWFIFPLLPIFIIFLIGSVAETNRAPFDLAEAESELVSGFMTEHAAVVFVFFFLAEYASIVLICIFITSLFLGGYLSNQHLIIEIFDSILYHCYFTVHRLDHEYLLLNPFFEQINYIFFFCFKTCILIFVFIWFRASLPRIRFDQLMSYCWTILLPILIAFILVTPCIQHGFSLTPVSI